jgi:hypothetical protein
MWPLQMHKPRKDLILFFETKCENMRISQNGFVVQLHSNKGVSYINIYSERKTEIITYGQKTLLETTLLK